MPKMSDWFYYSLFIIGMLFLGYLRIQKKKRVYRRLPERSFPKEWRKILEKRVRFFQQLSPADKEVFEYEVHVFLLNYKISGENTDVTDIDRVLVAAGGVIPTFRLKKWHYRNLEEIIIFPNKFKIPGTEKMARGLVGWGAMSGQLWLSRKALYEGFAFPNDGKNVAIHEFIHLMDMQDGYANGILDELMDDEDVEVWMELFNLKSKEIAFNQSSIRSYAKENPVEFLAATAEFYFENPVKLRADHPKLYRMLDRIFKPNKNWF